MVRLKYSVIAKLFALFFFALFIIPSLLKLFSGSSSGPLDEGGEKEFGFENLRVNNEHKRNIDPIVRY